MDSGNAESESRVLNVYEKLRKATSEPADVAREQKNDVLNTSETNDRSSKQGEEKDKEELRKYCQIKEQIAQMKNRLNFIDISMVKNKGKLDNTEKKTDTFLQVRSFAADIEKKLEERKQKEELETKQLKERVAQFNLQTSLSLQKKKEKVRQQKLQISEKVKQEKEEIREKIKKQDEEFKAKMKQVVQNQKEMRSSGSLLRFEARGLNDSMDSRIRACSIKDFKMDRGVPQKLYNVYGNNNNKRTEYGIESVQELKKTLDELAQEEAKKIDELQKILDLNKKASTRLTEVTKAKKK